MKAARLGRTPEHDKGASHASMKSARRKSHGNFRTSVPQFPRAIRKTHLRCYPLLRSYFCS